VKAGYGTAYAKARRELLADGPRCCVPRCRRKATTADHYPALAVHDHVDGSGCCELRPMCLPCNTALGALLGSALAAQRRQRKRDAGVSSRAAPAAPRPLPSRSPRKAPARARSKRTKPDPPKLGRLEPRLVTPLPGGVASWGSEVADWSLEHLGVKFMPWQRFAVDGMLAQRSPTSLLARRSLISVARQNGKTQILKALIGWWMTEAKKWRGGERQTVLQIAHRLDLLRDVFDHVAPILADLVPGAVVKWSYGRQSVTFPDRSQWLIASARPSSGHGFSVDLAVLDELWSIPPDVVEIGVAPATRARRSPLIAAFSTAGDQSSTLMLQWREAGLRAIDSGLPGPLYLAEWSPPPGADPDDPATWAWANPALGHTIELDTIRDEAQGDDRNAFLRSSLNLWVAASKAWLQPGEWEACRVDPGPAQGGGVLACDVSTDGKRWAGVRAWASGPGRHRVRGQFRTGVLGRRRPRPRRRPQGQVRAHPAAGGPLPRAVRAAHHHRGHAEVTAWTGTVRSAILDGRVLHGGEQLLAEHVERAVGVQSNRSLTLSSMKSPGPIELCRCMIWAWTLATVPKSRRRPAIVYSG
jgi:hypothetical protein